MSLEVTQKPSLVDGGASLEFYLRHEATLQAAEEYAAEQIAFELQYTLEVPAEIRKLSSEVAEQLYDPTLPTVAIDCQHAYAGSELLGVANSRLERRQCNVVYLNTATAELEIAAHDEGVQLRASRGYILDGVGDIYAGKFPAPIAIDAVETVDLELLSRLSDLGVQTLSKPEVMRFLNDKANLSDLAETVGARTPNRLSRDELVPGLDAVIKPSKESQGRGVYFTSNYPNDSEAWRGYYDFLQNHGYEPVIEERIRCWPVHDPKTGDQLDWNVRAIVSDGRLVSMYVRAGEIDTPINKTAGARSIPMAQFYRLLDNEHGATARVLTHALENTATDIAERYPAFMTGLDLTINELGEVVMFEANAGHVGGPQTIAHINGGSLNTRLKGSGQLLQDIAEQLPDKQPRIASDAEFTPFDLSFESKVDFTQSVKHPDALYGYLASTPPPEDSSTFAKLRAKLVESEVTQLLAPHVAHGHITELIDRYPLELSDYPELLSSHLLGSQALSAAIAEYSQTEGLSDEWRILNAHRAAAVGDLRTAMTIYQELLDDNKVGQAKAIKRRIVIQASNELPAAQVPEYRKDVEMTLRILADNLCERGATVSPELEAGLQSITEELEPQDERRVLLLCGLTRLALLTGSCDQAAKHAAELNIDDERQGDFILDLLNKYGDVLLASDAGASFYINQHARFGLYGAVAADLIGEAHEQQRSIYPHVLDSLANAHMEFSDEDRQYYRQAIAAAAEGAEVLPQPDAASALQLFGYVIWSQSRPDQSDATQQMCDHIANLHPEFRGDIDYFRDIWMDSFGA